MEVLLHSEETPILLLHFLKFCFCYFLNKNNKNEIRRKVYISYASLFSTSLFPPVLWWRCGTPVRTDQERTLGTRACRMIQKYTAAVHHGNPREMVLALVSRSATDLAETFVANSLKQVVGKDSISLKVIFGSIVWICLVLFSDFKSAIIIFKTTVMQLSRCSQLLRGYGWQSCIGKCTNWALYTIYFKTICTQRMEHSRIYFWKLSRIS